MLALKANVKKVSVVVFQKCQSFIVTVNPGSYNWGGREMGASFLHEGMKKF